MKERNFKDREGETKRERHKERVGLGCLALLFLILLCIYTLGVQIAQIKVRSICMYAFTPKGIIYYSI